MSYILNPSFSAMGPHAGTISMIPTNMRVKVDGAPAAVAADTFLVAGCTFQIAGVPAPCVMVNWMVTAMRVKVGGQPVVTSAQMRVKAQ